MPTTFLNAETIEQITLPSGKDEGLGNLNVIKQLILLHREPETFCVPISEKRVELRLGAEDNVLITKLGVVWRLLRSSWCPQPS